MTEIETLIRAKTYIEKLANGINPIDDTVIPESDTLNNVRLSRCLFYVSDVLRQVIEDKEKPIVKKVAKENFYITFEEMQKFEYSDVPISITEIAKRINALTDSDNMKKITYKNITDWLLSIEILEVSEKPNGKTTKMPTKHGSELGIITELRTGAQGVYTAVLYNRNAQQFVIDNIEAIVALMNG